MTDVYEKLAKHLDDLPGGYPATESGVELRILRRLFTPEEAELAVRLTMMPEPPGAIAARTGLNAEALASKLEEMSRKGQIFRAGREGNYSYSAAMFVVGIWEYHVKDLTEDLVKDVNEYLPQLAKAVWMKDSTNHLRVVPISKDIAAGMSISSYEDAEDIIRKQKKIVVQPCICRMEHKVLGEPCDYPLEVCLSFGSGAYYYEENNLGRSITVEEALEILETGRKAGLALQPSNSQNPLTLCMCCGCCCLFLKNIKAMDKPGQYVHTSYFAQVDAEKCIACGACAEACHMEAITVDETAVVNPDRCIGCGVCVAECPSDAMVYRQKEQPDQYVPPANIVETFMNMALERGKV